MKPHADTAGGTAHRAAWEVLPWLLNGSLRDAERDTVEAHLCHCSTCRMELERLRAVRCATLSGAAPACDPERGLARMLPLLAPDAASIAHGGAPPGWLGRRRDRLAANASRWLRTAMLAQAALIAVLLVALVRPGAPGGAPYHALGASGHAAAKLIVVFRPDTTERELRRIVRASGARIVDGPTTTDAYLLAAYGRAGAALATLRAEPAVSLAEALDTQGRP